MMCWYWAMFILLASSKVTESCHVGCCFFKMSASLLCSRRNKACIAVRPMFSLLLASPSRKKINVAAVTLSFNFPTGYIAISQLISPILKQLRIVSDVLYAWSTWVTNCGVKISLDCCSKYITGKIMDNEHGGVKAAHEKYVISQFKAALPASRQEVFRPRPVKGALIWPLNSFALNAIGPRRVVIYAVYYCSFQPMALVGCIVSQSWPVYVSDRRVNLRHVQPVALSCHLHIRKHIVIRTRVRYRL